MKYWNDQHSSLKWIASIWGQKTQTKPKPEYLSLKTSNYKCLNYRFNSVYEIILIPNIALFVIMQPWFVVTTG